MKFSIAVATLAASLVSAATHKLPFNSKASKQYLVSSRVPGIPFDLGPSWAGLHPLNGKASDPRKFFFWMFPSETKVGQEDLTIWLNGGPGCSSLEGLMQENGPFALPFNSTDVVKSDFSWTKLSNVLWVEQPVSVGFGTGRSTATNEDEVSTDFRDFLDSFMETFPEMKNKKLWITGESYAGKYIPYIADKIYQRSAHENKKKGLNLKGIAINDPSFVNDYFGEDLPAVEFVLENNQYFGFNDSVIQQLKNDASKNGMTDFVKKNLQYPPKGPIKLPSKYGKNYRPWGDVATLASEVNPNFNVYNVKDSKLIYDPLGYPPANAEPFTDNWLNNATKGGGEAFKKAIHVDPKKQWVECVDGVLRKDTSPPPNESILPGVISNSVRTVIQHGALDFVLIGTGSALGIQNMTWGGKQGFQTQPNKTLIVEGQTKGRYHTERGLTFVDNILSSGHMIPQDDPPVGFKLQKFLLGQISEAELSK